MPREEPREEFFLGVMKNQPQSLRITMRKLAAPRQWEAIRPAQRPRAFAISAAMCGSGAAIGMAVIITKRVNNKAL